VLVVATRFQGGEIEEAKKGPTSRPTRDASPAPMDPNHTVEQKSSNSDHVFAAPSVRHFARQQRVDLGLLAPGKTVGLRKGTSSLSLTTNAPRVHGVRRRQNHLMILSLS